MNRICVTVLMVLISTSAFAEDVTPRRQGFMFEFAVGTGLIEAFDLDASDSRLLKQSFEPHAISLGGYLNPKLALMWRWSSAYYFAKNASGKTCQGVFGTHGLHAQYWLTDRWYVSAGLAMGAFGNVLGRDKNDPKIKVGFANELRTGYAIALWEKHALLLSFKNLSGFFDGGVVLGQIVSLEYQLH